MGKSEARRIVMERAEEVEMIPQAIELMMSKLDTEEKMERMAELIQEENIGLPGMLATASLIDRGEL